MLSASLSPRILGCFSIVLLAATIPAAADNPAPLTLADLKCMSPCELEQVFSRGTAVVPVGKVRGYVLCRVEGKLPRLRTRMGGTFWKGKDFCEDGYFTNLWLGGIRAVDSVAFVAPSWFDDRPCVILEHEPKQVPFGNTRDEFRQVGCGLYLGRFYQRRPCPLHQGYFALEMVACDRPGK
jgi:hypothetical protein